MFQDPDGSLGDSLLPSDDVIDYSGHMLDSDSAQASSSEPQRRKEYRGHFRQRSVSDANLTTLHLSESKFTTHICCCSFPPPKVERTASFHAHSGYDGVLLPCVFVSAGELNATSRGQQRFSTDDMLLKLTDDSQNQVKEKKKKLIKN